MSEAGRFNLGLRDFDPRDSDPRLWIESLEEAASINHWGQEHLLANARFRLVGTAKQWHNAWKTYGGNAAKTWEGFLAAFCERYAVSDSELYVRLSSCRQGTDEAVRDYADRYLSLMSQLRLDADRDQSHMYNFLKGLRNGLYKLVYLTKPRTLSAAIRDAVYVSEGGERVLEEEEDDCYDNFTPTATRRDNYDDRRVRFDSQPISNDRRFPSNRSNGSAGPAFRAAPACAERDAPSDVKRDQQPRPSAMRPSAPRAERPGMARPSDIEPIRNQFSKMMLAYDRQAGYGRRRGSVDTNAYECSLFEQDDEEEDDYWGPGVPPHWGPGTSADMDPEAYATRCKSWQVCKADIWLANAEGDFAPTRGVVDSGVSNTVVTRDTLRKLDLLGEVEGTSVSFITADGAKGKAAGRVEGLQISLGDVVVSLDAYVSNATNYGILLGADFLAPLKADIRYSDNCLVYNNDYGGRSAIPITFTRVPRPDAPPPPMPAKVLEIPRSLLFAKPEPVRTQTGAAQGATTSDDEYDPETYTMGMRGSPSSTEQPSRDSPHSFDLQTSVYSYATAQNAADVTPTNPRQRPNWRPSPVRFQGYGEEEGDSPSFEARARVAWMDRLLSSARGPKAESAEAFVLGLKGEQPAPTPPLPPTVNTTSGEPVPAPCTEGGNAAGGSGSQGPAEDHAVPQPSPFLDAAVEPFDADQEWSDLLGGRPVRPPAMQRAGPIHQSLTPGTTEEDSSDDWQLDQPAPKAPRVHMGSYTALLLQDTSPSSLGSPPAMMQRAASPGWDDMSEDDGEVDHAAAARLAIEAMNASGPAPRTASLEGLEYLRALGDSIFLWAGDPYGEDYEEPPTPTTPCVRAAGTPMEESDDGQGYWLVDDSPPHTPPTIWRPPARAPQADVLMVDAELDTPSSQSPGSPAQQQPDSPAPGAMMTERWGTTDTTTPQTASPPAPEPPPYEDEWRADMFPPPLLEEEEKEFWAWEPPVFHEDPASGTDSSPADPSVFLSTAGGGATPSGTASDRPSRHTVLALPPAEHLRLAQEYGQRARAQRGPADPSDERVALLDKVDASLPTATQARLAACLTENYDMFAISNSQLGRTDWVQANIDTGDSDPVCLNPYRLSRVEKEAVEAEVARMLADGVVRHSTSEWSSPVVMVKKSDGSLRFCMLIDTLTPPLDQQRVFTAIDLKSGFWQVEVAEADRKKLAFQAPSGLYEFCVLPMGARCSPAIFQRLLSLVLRPVLAVGAPDSHSSSDAAGRPTLPGCAVLFIDDICVYSPDVDSHVRHLQQVFDLLRLANLRMALKKCEFAKPEVGFLGHKIDGRTGTITPAPKNISVVSEYPLLRTVRQVKAFLGLTSYYRAYVEGYSLIANPLYDCLGKEGYRWGPQQQAAFEELKRALTCQPILQGPDFDRPFILATDFCKTAVAVCLSQLDDEGRERAVSFASKRLSGCQLSWSSTDGEAFAAVWAIRFYHEYLCGTHFTLVTDNSALTFIMRAKDLTGKLARYALRLQGYDFTIVHRAGRKMGHVDGLSRLGHLVDDETDGEDEAQPPALSALAAEFSTSTETYTGDWAREWGAERTWRLTPGPLGGERHTIEVLTSEADGPPGPRVPRRVSPFATLACLGHGMTRAGEMTPGAWRPALSLAQRTAAFGPHAPRPTGVVRGSPIEEASVSVLMVEGGGSPPWLGSPPGPQLGAGRPRTAPTGSPGFAATTDGGAAEAVPVFVPVQNHPGAEPAGILFGSQPAATLAGTAPAGIPVPMGPFGLGASGSQAPPTSLLSPSGQRQRRRREPRLPLKLADYTDDTSDTNSVDSIACSHCGLRKPEWNMLLCDHPGCDRAFHTTCLRPPLRRLPPDAALWYCPEHQAGGSGARRAATTAAVVGQDPLQHAARAEPGTPGNTGASTASGAPGLSANTGAAPSAFWAFGNTGAAAASGSGPSNAGNTGAAADRGRPRAPKPQDPKPIELGSTTEEEDEPASGDGGEAGEDGLDSQGSGSILAIDGVPQYGNRESSVWLDEALLMHLRDGGLTPGPDTDWKDYCRESQRVQRKARRYYLQGDLLYRRGRAGKPDVRVLKLAERQAALADRADKGEAHGKAHPGARTTYNLLKGRYTWDGMGRDVKTYVDNCKQCQPGKHFLIKNTPLKPLEHVGLFQRVHVDLCGPLPLTPRGNRYIAVAIDSWSKWPETAALPNKQSDTTARWLWEQFITRYGTPTTILSDNGGEWACAFEDLLRRERIQHRRTSAYTPTTNGACERFVATLRGALVRLCQEGEETDWDLYVPQVTYAYRTGRQATTRVSPTLCLFGRELTLAMQRGEPQPRYEDEEEVVTEVFGEADHAALHLRQAELESVEGVVRANVAQAQAKMVRDHARRQHVSRPPPPRGPARPLPDTTPARADPAPTRGPTHGPAAPDDPRERSPDRARTGARARSTLSSDGGQAAGRAVRRPRTQADSGRSEGTEEPQPSCEEVADDNPAYAHLPSLPRNALVYRVVRPKKKLDPKSEGPFRFVAWSRSGHMALLEDGAGQTFTIPIKQLLVPRGA
ncbi:Retrovirus-related Pol polyprotein from transposon [Tetrabaena socialis]|uniref:Retrovirus-related Pol polyprotein from transposon n=1 Tax=Tetrabaena socialis TaxID=47790 RepID=A0A2J8A5D3_9CHLO|nr:Retrovirus-related Pol polyprotein from transposon [Tetrabaena socialis]|eukprot:PNH07731.1 Retrovirus-related Pol polyprotein from transposon [Tetrabaena socialis]